MLSNLTWFGWILLVLEILSIVVTVNYIERPRPALTSQVAIFSIIITLFCIWGIVFVGTTH